MSTRTSRRLAVEILETREVPSFTPVGPEFRVNQQTVGRQFYPATAVNASGDFVVAFAGAGVNQEYGIWARRYGTDGTPYADQFKVAPAVDEFTNDTSVAMNANGDFVVVWAGPAGATLTAHFVVSARSYFANGDPKGPAFAVTQDTVESLQPDVAIDAAGNFAISWAEFNSPATDYLKVQRFSSNGTPATPVLTTLSGFGEESTLSLAADGSIALAWQGTPISVCILDPTGQVVGTIAEVGALHPDIAFAPSGNVVLTWSNNSVPGLMKGYVRQYSSTGTPIGSAFQLGTAGTFAGFSTVAVDATGNSVVAWQNGATGQIMARSFGSDGVPTDAAQQINTYIPGNRNRPKVALNPGGDGVIAWVHTTQDGSGSGIFAQRILGALSRVGSSSVNGGTKQRSSVSKLDLGFNRPIVFPTDPTAALVLTGPTGTLPVSLDLSGSTALNTKAKVVLPLNLPDGRYSLRVNASMVHGPGGELFDGNGDGIPGDDYVTTFHKLTGDFNGDARVDMRDFLLFRTALATNDLSFDLDGDGDLDSADFAVFRLRFGMTV